MSGNLLKNPELKGFTIFREIVDRAGNKGWMEHPDDWEFVWTPQYADDPDRVPQSLHRDKGFCIAAGWRAWEAGYVQRGVGLTGGARYCLRVVFRPDVNFSPGHEPDLTAIQWRLVVLAGGAEIAQSGWQVTHNWQYKQMETLELVFILPRDMQVDVAFMARSLWANNACDFNVFSITLEEVATDYGQPVPVNEDAATATPAPVPAPVTEPESPASPAPVPTPTGASVDLFALMSDDDLTVIAQGFREAASATMFGDTIAAGFARWADVLERYRNQRS